MGIFLPGLKFYKAYPLLIGYIQFKTFPLKFWLISQCSCGDNETKQFIKEIYGGINGFTGPPYQSKAHYPKLSTLPQRKELLFMAIFPIGADWQKRILEFPGRL